MTAQDAAKVAAMNEWRFTSGYHDCCGMSRIRGHHDCCPQVLARKHLETRDD